MKKAIVFALLILFLGCKDDSLEKGRICLALGDYPMAIDFFTAHLKTYPHSFEARLGLGKALLQQYADENSRITIWKQAVRQLEAARTLHPEIEVNQLLSTAYLERCQMYLDMGDSLSALTPLTHALDSDPENKNALTLAGILAYKQGLEQRALTLFQQVLLLDTAASDIHFNIGTIYWNRKDYVLAQDHWLAALEIDSSNTDILDWVFRVNDILEGKR